MKKSPPGGQSGNRARFAVGAAVLIAAAVSGTAAADPRPCEYTAQGSTTKACLVRESVWRDSMPPFADPARGTGPVTLADRLPFPNPHSVPICAVGVADSARLQVDVLGPEGEPLDSFAFPVVEPGWYQFTIEGRLGGTGMATIIARCPEAPADSLAYSLLWLNRLIK